jgi:AcrR family transcriptional regulator
MENERSPDLLYRRERWFSAQATYREMDDETAEARVLEAADRLFYEHGIGSVGMDAIRDASGVSLKRLYRLFPAKEQLAEAALRRRDESFRRSLAEFTAGAPSPRERILAIFDYLDEWFAEPDYRGCPFINAFGEMRASISVTDAIKDQKGALQAFVGELVRAAGAPAALTGQLLVLINGAMATSAILGSTEPAQQAKAAAQALLDNAQGHGAVPSAPASP